MPNSCALFLSMSGDIVVVSIVIDGYNTIINDLSNIILIINIQHVHELSPFTLHNSLKIYAKK